MKKLMLVCAVLVVFTSWALYASEATARFGADSFILGAQMRVAQAEGLFDDYGIDAEVLTFSYGVDTKLGVAAGTLQEYVTYKYLEVNNIPKNAVKYVKFTSLYDIVAALGTGDIDGAWVWAQGVEKALEFGGIHILCDDSAAGHRSYGFLVASIDFVRSNPELTIRIMRAFRDVTTWILENMEDAARIVAEQVGAPEDTVLTEMQRENYCFKLTTAHVDHLNSLLSWMYEAGIIDKQLKAEDYIEECPLKMIDPEAVTL